MKHNRTYGFDTSPLAYRGTSPAQPPMMALHDFIALEDGRLAHQIDGFTRAIVEPAGFDDYLAEWPAAELVIATLKAAEKSAAETVQAAPAEEPAAEPAVE